MTAFEHSSVLSAEVLDQLVWRDHGIYVDGTLGGGGHAEAVLERAPGAKLLGIDRDLEALEAARSRLRTYGDRVRFVHTDYVNIPLVLEELGTPMVEGILLDLGVSSPQLDHPERGFSFTRPGPLDMRMDPTRGQTALELLNNLDEVELADVIKDYGEERHAKKVARLIKEALGEGRITNTVELAAVIATAIPIVEQRKSKIHPATRTFQALRIAVNAELDQLERFLAGFPDLLVPGGRCAIISFHSLEDRLVKNRFRDLAWTSSLPPALAAKEGERTEAVCELITRKGITASDDEIARNPRARSARLRVCARTSAPNVQATRTGLSPVGRSRFDD